MNKHPNLFEDDAVSTVEEKEESVSSVDDEEENFDDFKEFMNPSHIKTQSQPPPLQESKDRQQLPSASSSVSESDETCSVTTAVASEISNENVKLDYISKLRALRENGHIVKDVSLNTKTSDLKLEYHRVKRSIELKSSIKFQQKMLMASVTAIEFLNRRFDPFDVNLEGWSENVLENIDDFEHIFEKLFEKYRSKRDMAPELELLIALAGSAFMFNLTNSLFKSSIPNESEFRNLQNTVRNAAAAAAAQNNNNNPPPPSQQQPMFPQVQMPDISSLLRQFSQPASAPVPQPQPHPQPQPQPPPPPQPSDMTLQQHMMLNNNNNNEDDLSKRFEVASSDNGSEPDIMISTTLNNKNKKQKKKEIIL